MAMRDGDARNRRTRSFPDLIRSIQAAHDAVDGAGLRERKKAQLRQLISDTATMMFLERGFDAVRVSEIAAACDVSEKTVFNYFPTKESLLFDNTDRIAQVIRESLRDHGDGRSITDSVHAAVLAEFERIHGYWRSGDPEAVLEVVRRFGDLIQRTPALLAAQHAMLDHFVAAAAEALAERAGVDPQDPEPQIAAMAVAGLWRVQFSSTRRHIHTVTTVEQLRNAVLGDVERAARIAEAGLSSFDAALVPGRRRSESVAAEDARRHVIAAMRHAREAWRAAREMHDAQRSDTAEQVTQIDHTAALRDEITRHRADIKRLRKLGDEAALKAEATRHRAAVRRINQALRAERSRH